MISYNKRLANLSLPEFYKSKMQNCNTTPFFDFKEIKEIKEIQEIQEIQEISVVPQDIYDKLFTGISHNTGNKENNKKPKKKTMKIKK